MHVRDYLKKYFYLVLGGSHECRLSMTRRQRDLPIMDLMTYITFMENLLLRLPFCCLGAPCCLGNSVWATSSVQERFSSGDVQWPAGFSSWLEPSSLGTVLHRIRDLEMRTSFFDLWLPLSSTPWAVMPFAFPCRQIHLRISMVGGSWPTCPACEMGHSVEVTKISLLSYIRNSLPDSWLHRRSFHSLKQRVYHNMIEI